MKRRQHGRSARTGRRQSDRRASAVDSRRILLVGADEAWSLLFSYVFEEAGYSVHAAADPCQSLAFTSRLLPDVVLVQIDAPGVLDLLAGLSAASSTSDIPVAVLTSSLQSAQARRARAAGGVTLRARPDDVAGLVGKVDALIATAAGLFAAIPAVYFYNAYTGRVKDFAAQMDDFALEFLNISERNFT